MSNQHTPRNQRAEPRIGKLILWPAARLERVKRAARAARKTVSDYIRDAADPPLSRPAEK